MNVQIFKNYTHQGLCRAIDIFNFPNSYPPLTRILGYRFLFMHREKDRRLSPSKEMIIESIKKTVKENKLDDNSILMELVDILLEYSNKDGNELLEYLRNKKLQSKKVPPKIDGPKGTIYADSQSVHNSAITNTIKSAAKYLCENFCPFLNNTIKEEMQKDIENKLKQNVIFVDSKDILKEVLHRIIVDNTKFEGYSTDIILFSLWNWIGRQNNQELYNRISEEIYEMHKYCPTRILSGLINSIQGFTNDENLIIKMSDDEQSKSVLYSYLDKILKECKDEKVIDGMYDKNMYFLDFIKKNVDTKKIEWQKEYGNDFIFNINKHVNNYTQSKIF